MRKMNTYINRILSFLLVATMVLQLQPQYIYANEPETGNTIIDEVVTPSDADNTDKPEEPSPDIEEEQNPNTEEPSPNPNEEQNVEEIPIVQKQPEPSEEQVPPVETEEQVSTASDGTLAGQPIRFVNLYWETNDLGELEVVFDGGSQEQKVLPLIKQDRGVYEGSIPTGDYSTVAFRQKGSTEILEDTRYNIYGNQEALIAEGQEKTSVVSYTNLIKDTFYYDMGKNPSYWASDPEYDGATGVSTLADSNDQTFNVNPGDIFYFIDLDGVDGTRGPDEIKRVNIGFIQKDHTSLTPTEEEYVAFTMYERREGIYSVPFPDNVNDLLNGKRISEIAFQLQTDNSQLNTLQHHYNFRNEEHSGNGDLKQWGHFLYEAGVTDAFYFNKQESDSYFGTHPSRANDSLDNKVLYIDTEDYNNNQQCADQTNLWIKWQGMPTPTEPNENFHAEKGYKLTKTVTQEAVRYFQFPMNSNATENTVISLTYDVIDSKKNEKITTRTFKFTYVSRNGKNMIQTDHIAEFDEAIWSTFNVGEVETRDIFLWDKNNKIDREDIYVRLANKEDGKYTFLDKQTYIDANVDSNNIVELDGSVWVKLNLQTDDNEYEKEDLYGLKLPYSTHIQYKATNEDNKTYYSKIEEIPETISYPSYMVSSLGKASDSIPDENTKEFGIHGVWRSVYANFDLGDESVDIPTGEFKKEDDVYYANTTFYDYYSDYELEGNKIETRKVDDHGDTNRAKFVKQSNEFNENLAQYYRDANWPEDNTNNPTYRPLFVGSYGDSLKDYWKGDTYGNKWTGSKNGGILIENINGTNKYGGPLEKLVDKTLKDGKLTSQGLEVPLFKEEFLRGDNKSKTAIGNVYKNVPFPFKRDTDENSRTKGYWVYDSGDENNFLRLSYDKNEGYFLDKLDKTIKVRSKSSFLPFNNPDVLTKDIDRPGGDNWNWSEFSKVNYMFGTHFNIDFSLTENRMIHNNSTGKNEPIRFEFQGDDDAWIYIDGILALDLGGIHDALRGEIDFQNQTYTIWYDIADTTNNNYEADGRPIPGKVETKFSDELIEKLNSSDNHTLTMFYMERGLFESNLKLSFNFPQQNRLTIDKEVDTTTNENKDSPNIFKDVLENMGGFTFNLKNLATSGEALPIDEAAGYVKPGKNIVVYNSSTTPTFEIDSESGSENSITGGHQIVQSGKIGDKNPEEKLLLKVKPKDSMDISNMSYLRLQLHNTGGVGGIENLYVGLLDSSGNRVGGYANLLGYEDETGTFKANEETVIRIDPRKMGGSPFFDWSNVSTILLGVRNDRAPENVTTQYIIQSIAFNEKLSEKIPDGFGATNEQISDYGSIKNGKLTDVDGVWYKIQSKDDSGNYSTISSRVVDNGQLSVSDGQRVVLEDKFRVGSYLSLEETDIDPKVFDTSWSLRENDQEIKGEYLLNTRQDVTTVVNPYPLITSKNEKPLENVKGYLIDDQRKEVINEDFSHPIDGEKAFVYRSYFNPDDSKSISLNLNATYKNTLKYGSITINKKLDEEMAVGGVYPTGDYYFDIYYTDIAGRSLEGQLASDANGYRYIKETVKVTVGSDGTGSTTVHNIPAGTKYWIQERPGSGAYPVKIKLGDSTGTTHENIQIFGVDENGTVTDVSQAHIEATAYDGNQEYIFTNKNQPFFMGVEKIWEDGLTDDERPFKEVHIKVERTVDGKNWKEVTEDYFGKAIGENSDYIVLNKENKWKVTSESAIPFATKDDTGKLYTYRIVELNDSGISNYYDVSYDEIITQLPEGEEKNLHITYRATNTQKGINVMKIWDDQEDAAKRRPEKIRVKLVGSTDYKPDNEQETPWSCYKKIQDEKHVCNDDCWIELTKDGNWIQPVKQLKIKDDTGRYYFYKLADEQFYYNNQWIESERFPDPYKVSYGEPVALNQQDEKFATISVTNQLPLGNIKIVKKDAKTENLLSGVKFKIERLKDNKVDSSFEPVEIKTDENGEAYFNHLPYGTYRISEVAPPSGYIALKKPIEIEISDKAFEEQAKQHKDDVDYDPNKKLITITIKNEKGLTIPETGGRGILMFTIIGTLLISIAVILTIRKKYNLQ